jgi:Protein of unknown function (DUF3631)
MPVHGVEDMSAPEVEHSPGYKLLDDIMTFIYRFVDLPYREGYVIIALWVVHTWGVESFQVTPRLGFYSDNGNSGKTTAGNVVASLAQNPHKKIAITAAGIFRTITAEIADHRPRPTFLFDDIHKVQAGRETDPKNDTMSIISNGYKRGYTIDRTEKNSVGFFKTDQYETFTPVIMAGLNRRTRDDTLSSRTFNFQMKPASAEAGLEDFYEDDLREEIDDLRARCKQFVEEHGGVMKAYRPPVHLFLNREKEIWTPLFAIAESADFLEDIEGALKTYRFAPRPLTLAQQYLVDIHAVWPEDVEFIKGADLTTRLIEHSPLWASLNGKPLTPTKLTKDVGEYFQIDGTHDTTGKHRGFYRVSFVEPWASLPGHVRPSVEVDEWTG